MKQFAYFAMLTFVSTVFLTTGVSVPVKPAYAASTSIGQTATSKPAGYDHVEKRIKKLHDDLKITPAQETLWNNVAQVMRENHKQMEELAKAREKNAKNMTAIEDLRSYSEIIDAHAAGLKKFIPNFEALYAGMSDEQKKNADVVFRGRIHKKSKGK